jgi:phenylacetate-CoA ligase
MKSRFLPVKIITTLAGTVIQTLQGGRCIDLGESQWWPLDKLLDFQNKRLRTMVAYAYRNIPAYRRKFRAAHVEPRDIRSIADLDRLPVTTREEMQDNQLFINKGQVSGTLYTGGSTGTSLRYFESKASGAIRWQAHLRGWAWSGYEYGTKRLAVVSSAQGIVQGENTLNLMGEMRDQNIEENVSRLLAFKPEYLRGYVSSVYILAKHCLDHDIQLDSIESVNVISENLYSSQREVIEKAFDCEVFEEYCCNDGGACAWECQAHQGLHYCMERAIIEELDGEMVVTDLWNKAMPFIRYRTGDAVTFLPERCSCGRQLPLLRIKGRTNDILIGPNGPISPTFLMHHGSGQVGVDKHMTRFRSGIRTVQYIQEPGFLLRVNLVKNSWCEAREIEEFLGTLREIAPGHDHRTSVCGYIARHRQGKAAIYH